VRRWNGWGDDAVEASLPGGAWSWLERQVGAGTPSRDASLAEAIAALPPARLDALGPFAADDPEDRLRHARGQSFPDWLAVRTGRVGWAPDGVAHPADRAAVRSLIEFAERERIRLIPYGGGSSVCGHVTPVAGDTGDRPVVTVALDRMSGLQRLEPGSGLATFGAGTPGPAVEAALESAGRTLGHFPQSFELSTVGGWVATRSVGQQARGNGRMDELFAGGHLEAPAGSMDLAPFPASAAGPDVRQLVLGSEGRLGVLTDVVVRTRPLPEEERFVAAFLPDLDSGIAACRELAGIGLPLSMIRLSGPAETSTTLAMAGNRAMLAAYRRYLGARGIGGQRCLLILAASGQGWLVDGTIRAASDVVRRHGGRGAPGRFASGWVSQRFRSAYLRNTLWSAGYGVDTIETAVTWDRLPALTNRLATGLNGALEAAGERVLAYSHLSHVYASGSSLYTTVVFRLARDPDETIQRWTTIKRLASDTIVAGGGTISHQHGVGRDHLSYVATEKGALALEALRAAIASFDPNGTMNPGVLLPAR
jgi:alkyldihydroxyacetonephosphate synthase